MENKKIVSLKDIVVDFDGDRVLDGLNLDIHDKEVRHLPRPVRLRQDDHAARHRRVYRARNRGMSFLTARTSTRLPPYKRQVNTVFQRYALFPHLNVFENVAFGLRLKKVEEKEVAPRRDGNAGACGPEGLRAAQHRPRFPAASSSGWPSPARW